MNQVPSVSSSLATLVAAHGLDTVLASLTGHVAGRAVVCRELSRSKSIPVTEKVRAGSQANHFAAVSEWLASCPTRESIRAAKVAAKEAKK
jgi:hypothetical protein